ncbi:MAG: hypothetical protein KDE59_06290 [Anaerolineales bacterium]|nr:hypothetical protein [Anaerolineales bacterium]
MRDMKVVRYFLLSFSLLAVLALAACGSSVAEPAADEHMDEMDHSDMEDMDHEDMEDMDHSVMEDMDHEHSDDEAANRIPNENNASVEILTPADGATFANGEDVLVEVAFENFDYGVDGNHWHIYLNDVSYGMVVGLNTSETVRGLEPGEYELLVVMANSDHIEYEDGAMIHITVEE